LSGKEAATFIFTFWACWTSRARLRRGFLTRWRGDSGRGERLTRLSTTAVTLNDTLSRGFACTLHFQLAMGTFPASRPNLREVSRPRVVHSDRLRICACHRYMETPSNGVSKRDRIRESIMILLTMGLNSDDFLDQPVKTHTRYL